MKKFSLIFSNSLLENEYEQHKFSSYRKYFLLFVFLMMSGNVPINIFLFIYEKHYSNFFGIKKYFMLFHLGLWLELFVFFYFYFSKKYNKFYNFVILLLINGFCLIAALLTKYLSEETGNNFNSIFFLGNGLKNLFYQISKFNKYHFSVVNSILMTLIYGIILLDKNMYSIILFLVLFCTESVTILGNYKSEEIERNHFLSIHFSKQNANIIKDLFYEVYPGSVSIVKVIKLYIL